jgi:hypothetical protein
MWNLGDTGNFQGTNSESNQGMTLRRKSRQAVSRQEAIASTTKGTSIVNISICRVPTIH